MNIQPHIIIEKGVEYHLGTLHGDTIQYDFQKMLIYLDHKGKMLFGKNFKIFEEDEVILFKLCIYFIKDYEYCSKFNIDPNKGILLSGPVGCGKTSLMKLMKYIVPHQKPYEVIPSRNITFAFNNLGYKTIEEYGNDGYYCFDDLGVEPLGRHYGKDCNVLGEIILSRYDFYTKANSQWQTANSYKKTHATTNLNAQELEDKYGIRVRSRMRQLFNLIAFHEKSADKRI